MARAGRKGRVKVFTKESSVIRVGQRGRGGEAMREYDLRSR
jgi:hypothetical protein